MRAIGTNSQQFPERRGLLKPVAGHCPLTFHRDRFIDPHGCGIQSDSGNCWNLKA
jgi:hypothetical protein